MRSALVLDEENLAATPAEELAWACDDTLMLARRLDGLQRQMDEVNRSLAQYLEQRQAGRRRKASSGEWLRFRRQAKRLAHYGPS